MHALLAMKIGDWPHDSLSDRDQWISILMNNTSHNNLLYIGQKMMAMVGVPFKLRFVDREGAGRPVWIKTLLPLIPLQSKSVEHIYKHLAVNRKVSENIPRDQLGNASREVDCVLGTTS
jgi:hypothetical protein